MARFLRTVSLFLGLALLCACQSETARFEGKWRSIVLDGTTIVLKFDGKGKDQILTIDTTINALSERVRFPVEILGNGIYAGQDAVGMTPGEEILFLEAPDRLVSQLGTFKR